MTGQVDPDTCNLRHCITHQKFSLNILENTMCPPPCGATSEPFSYSTLVHYISAKAIVEESSGRKNRLSFGELLKKAGSIDDERECPNFVCNQYNFLSLVHLDAYMFCFI